MGKGTAFGKTILIGDQFVLREVPAIVASLPFYTEASVEPIEGEGWVLEDNRQEVPGYKNKKASQQIDSINRILEVMKVDIKKTPLKITYGGSLLAGSGVGASAASCVSLARALNDEFKLGYRVEQINQVGWEGEFADTGTQSVVDKTVASCGGLIVSTSNTKTNGVQKIKIKAPLRVVLANSGVTADTSKLDIFVEREEARDLELFLSRLKTIRDQVKEMKQALEAYNLDKVGDIMTANHQILIEMDLSHQTLIYLCEKAIQMGALGAKLTGGGRGGYMVALTPDKELQNEIASAFEQEGFKVIKATIGQE